MNLPMVKSCALLSSLLCFSASAIDFSGPLQDVQASVNGSLVTYSVMDPVYGLRQGSANTPGSFISTPSTAGGLVTWVASNPGGSTVYYRIYDPGRSNWIGGSSPSAPSIIGPINDSGLVAWLANGSISFTIYDPIAGGWNTPLFPFVGFSNLKNNGGMIVGLNNQTVYCLSFDPFKRTWVETNLTTAGYIPDVFADSGVIAWTAGRTVYAVTYDAGRGAWKTASAGGGVDEVSLLNIANSTVRWVAGTPMQNYSLGYNSATGTWGSQATPVRASFTVSANSGNPPLFIWFTDLSLGGTAWSWNFGDGSTATGRTPYHVFNGLGRYTVVQTVGGSSGMATASTNILTDLATPSGTIKINNDEPYTRSASVTLSLAITDNSGTVSMMRFSNTNGVNWSSWYPYASSFNWTLSPNDGLKSVYAQFTDPSSNIFLVSDSITLDSRPPPAAYITNYFVKESVPSLQVGVQLSNSTPFKVSVDYATSDGTATAGIDYGNASGTITFLPFETYHTFTLYLTNDTAVELNETIVVTLSNPTNATLTPPATVTILDDDPPTVTFLTDTFTIDEYAPQAIITANLNAASGLSVNVNYATSNGTATASSDYSAVSGTLLFSPGQTSRSFAVPILPDSVDEPDETVRLYLSSPTNALLGPFSTAILKIIDDDPPPASFTTNNYQVDESAGSIAIPVRLNTPFAQTVFVGYMTSDGTAKAGSNYVAASGTLVYGPGETNKTFLITIFNNTLHGNNATVFLSLTSFNNAIPGLFISASLSILGGGPPPVWGPSTWQAASGFHSTLSGPQGHIYSVEASSNLTQWAEVQRLTNSAGAVNFTDPAATTVRRNFYRSKQVQ